MVLTMIPTQKGLRCRLQDSDFRAFRPSVLGPEDHCYRRPGKSLLFIYLTVCVYVTENFVHFASFDYSPTGRGCTLSLLEVFWDVLTMVVQSVTVLISHK